MASILDAVGVDARCGPLRGTSQWVTIATIIIDIFQIEGVDVSGEVAENCEQNVDPEVNSAACNHKDTKRGNE